MGSDGSCCEKMEPAESVVRDESSWKPSLKAQVQSSGKMLRDYTCCFPACQTVSLILSKDSRASALIIHSAPKGPVFSTERHDCLNRVSIAVTKHCDHKAIVEEKVYLAYTPYCCSLPKEVRTGT